MRLYGPIRMLDESLLRDLGPIQYISQTSSKHPHQFYCTSEQISYNNGFHQIPFHLRFGHRLRLRHASP
ncbi:unnamed protein product [Nezara viridula]|uniref:Uncharacterized protein n=1 Tax=Nezara viridula TaxID=85310 RepID=A0A9P0HMV6_NEZVI|nr:unnamed protein product [Nezara viridula]